MTAPVYTIGQDEAAADAWETMRFRRTRQLVVNDVRDRNQRAVRRQPSRRSACQSLTRNRKALRTRRRADFVARRTIPVGACRYARGTETGARRLLLHDIPAVDEQRVPGDE